MGLEPTTISLRGRCSTIELQAHFNILMHKHFARNSCLVSRFECHLETPRQDSPSGPRLLAGPLGTARRLRACALRVLHGNQTFSLLPLRGNCKNLVPSAGLEPATSTSEAWRSIQLSYKGIWGGRSGSNRQPTVPQTVALPLSYGHHTTLLLLYRTWSQVDFC